MTRPKTLPPIDDLPPPKVEVIDRALQRPDLRICPKCKVEGRVVSNDTGVFVLCNTCKDFWPLSGAVNYPRIGADLSRGLMKQTVMEPDYSLAYDYTDEDREDRNEVERGRKYKDEDTDE